jgi:adenylate cyclase
VPQSRVIPEAAIIEQLERLLASRDFDASSRGRTLLHFMVAETLAHRQESLTLATIAKRVFGRGEDFDSSLDPAVRIEVSRLRRALDRYARVAGAEDPVCIALPYGASAPVLRWAGGSSSPRRIGHDASESMALARR